MLIRTMGAMMERIGPLGIHYLGSSPNSSPAKQEVEGIYRQMRRDFFVASPFILHASVPSLLAGAWALVRESLFTGEVAREKKEVIAWAISRGNACPFCIDAHHAAVRAAKVEDAPLAAWAEATARTEALPSAPFETLSEPERAEVLATVVAFHYLNRMVSVFLDPKMMPVPDAMDPVAAMMAQTMMGGMMAKGRANRPGDALALLPDHDATLAWRPDWAQACPTVAEALAGWSAIAEGEARARLDPALVGTLDAALETETPATLHTGDLMAEAQPLSLRLRIPAELALLVARAPARVEKSRIASVLDVDFAPEAVLALVAWVSSRAARQAGTRAAQSFASSPSPTQR